MQHRRSFMVFACLLATACGPQPDAPDASDAAVDGRAMVGDPCATASTCDDGLICNGVETCAAGHCSAGTPMLCDDGIACTIDGCSEMLRACTAHAPDADGDGVEDATCHGPDGVPLGTDCDDGDPARYPANAEVCDATGHDEDCDSSTYGARDEDDDRYDDRACCNGTGDTAICGEDCDDSRATVRPLATDVCNATDDDCDGMIDEMATITIYVDGDGDGFGAEPGMPGCVGTPGTVMMGGDCDDANAAVHPGLPELDCNGLDDDCSGMAGPTEDRDGDGYASTLCGGSDCADGDATRHPGAPEVCNFTDSNCDGDDEDVDDDFHYAVGSCTPTGTALADDCDDLARWISPAATELCDDRDGDCDGTIDEDACAGVVDVAAGTSHTCTVLSDGRVACWGSNGSGELGDGSRTDRLLPVLATGVTDAIAVGAGDVFTCILRSGGGVACAGDASAGRLGNGRTSGTQTTFEDVMAVTDAVQLSVGRRHACVRNATGVVTCWGAAGVGSSTPAVPAAVAGLTDVTDIAAGNAFTCAVRAGGAVSCWGLNDRSQLGDGTLTTRTTPTPMRMLADAVDVEAGDDHACGVRTSGQVVCWGDNSRGELGARLAASSSPDPVDVLALGGGAPFADGLTTGVGVSTGSQISCALHAAGQLACWGDDADGAVGDGTPGGTVRSYSDVPGLSMMSRVSVGASHVCALRADGRVLCWGSGADGRLGDGTTMSHAPALAITP